MLLQLRSKGWGIGYRLAAGEILTNVSCWFAVDHWPVSQQRDRLVRSSGNDTSGQVLRPELFKKHIRRPGNRNFLRRSNVEINGGEHAAEARCVLFHQARGGQKNILCCFPVVLPVE